MQLYILGKHTDDKGTQLEQLTKRLLESQGYSNIVRNEVVSGGNEIDVAASKKSVVGTKEIDLSVICECKAHGKPISMTDWLKFIGKIFLERKKNEHTIGLLIALSGANGNVMGSYKDIETDGFLQLICNDDIIKIISDLFKLKTVADIKKQIQGLIETDITEINLLYYEYKVWWVISLSDNTYTLLGSHGEKIVDKTVNDLLDMISIYTPYSKSDYQDIYKSYDLNCHLAAIRNIMLTSISDGKIHSIDEVQSHNIDLKSQHVVDRESLLVVLRDCPFVNYDEKAESVSLKGDEEIDIIEFYRYILVSGVPVEMLFSDFYQRHIDKSLLERIYSIQYGFRMPDWMTEKILFLLRYSPSALLYGVFPDTIFHSFEITKVAPDMSALYENHFMKSLTAAFLRDFHDQHLQDTYLHKFKVDKVSQREHLQITQDENVIDVDTSVNSFLATLDMENVSPKTVMIVAKG